MKNKFDTLELAELSYFDSLNTNGGEVEKDSFWYNVGYVLYSAACDFGELFTKKAK
jgi:hypothetical protein